MYSGWFGQCSDTSWAWLDPGCAIQNVSASTGSAVTSLLQPVWIILAIALVALFIIAFSPNVRHFV